MLSKLYSVERINTTITSRMEASWLITRDDGTVVLSVQAEGHPEALELLESAINEGFSD